MSGTFLSTFSGVGGIDLGLERAGWRCVGQAEADPYRRAVLAERFPGVPIAEDVRGVKGPYRPDLVCGGFPCQPWSVAGRRGGESDERHLWPELLRIIRETRPRWVLLENVPGLITDIATHSPGDDRCPVCGWAGGWGGLPDDRQGLGADDADRDGGFGIAAADDVARRPRRFAVAVPRSVGEVAGGVDLDPVGPPTDAGADSGRAEPSGEARPSGGAARVAADQGSDHEARRIAGEVDPGDAARGGSPARAGAGPQRTRARRDVGVAGGCPACRNRGRGGDVADVALRSGLRTVLRDLAHVGPGLGYGCAYRVLDSRFFGVPQRRRRVFIVASDVGGRAGAECAGQVLAVGSGCGGHFEAGGEAGAGATGGIAHGAGVTRPLTTGTGQRLDAETDDMIVVNTLDRMAGGPDDNAAQAGHLVPVASNVRRLTPRECERLQGFPDDWTLIEWQGKPAADSRRYAACGDAVTVPVAQWLSERLMAAHMEDMRVAA